MIRTFRSALLCASCIFAFVSRAVSETSRFALRSVKTAESAEAFTVLQNRPSDNALIALHGVSSKRSSDVGSAAAKKRTSPDASANGSVSDIASLEDELSSLPLVQTLDAEDSRNPFPNEAKLPESADTENGMTTEDIEVKAMTRDEMPLSLSYKELDIPGADRVCVQKYRDYYLSEKAVKWLSSVLENGEQYRLYVREKLKERGMPSVLEYLPVVESSYTTNAKSRSGAVGLWQFMANSTKPFLLRNDFVDERLDPWKSTDAALAKLQENFNMFHDWSLAIAAYNCGAGAMARALAKNPGKDFWYLAEHKQLRAQTVEYVPKLLAVADVAENAAYYAVAIPSAKNEKGEPVNPRAGRFDYAETKGAISIRRLAHELKIDEDTLSSLNSALFRGITPPASVWRIRVPEGMARSAAEAIESIEPFRFQTRYTVREGDSLWRIAERFGTTVDALCDANNVKSSAVLRIGKILYIPVK